MEHVAIDLGGRESQVCVRKGDATIVLERRVLTRHLPVFLKSRPQSRVVMETCTEAFAIADSAKSLGHEVRVVPATLVRTLGVGARKVKNDRRDAQALSEVSCRLENLPSVHVPSERARDWKSRCSARDALVSSRTLLVNSVRAWVRASVQISLRKRGVKTLPQAIRTAAAEVGLVLPDHVERRLLTIEALTEQIREADKEIAQLAKQDSVCRLLMTKPGVGPQTAVRFVATIDDIRRFPNAHKLESYLGLTPGENSSSDRRHFTGITKAGAPRMRWLLGQAAWSSLRATPKDPMSLWAHRVMHRRGTRIAVVALARKLAGVLFAMWRDGRPYNAMRACPEVPAESAEPTQHVKVRVYTMKG